MALWKEFFSVENQWYFPICAPIIDCWYSLETPQRGGSNEYQQSMFRAKVRKIMYTPGKPYFLYIKWDFQGVHYTDLLTQWVRRAYELHIFASLV